MRFNSPIYPITNTELSGLTHAEQTKKLVEAGVDLIQLREKHMTPRDLCSQAIEALQVARDAGVKLLINDRVDLALAIGADGVHVGQDDLPPQEARRVLGKTAIIGFSTHTVEQAVAAAKLPVDYIALGPIFPTDSKDNPDDVTGVKALQAARSLIENIPIVAIGGIDATNINTVAASGANAAAVISAIYSDERSITEEVNKLRKKWLNKNV